MHRFRCCGWCLAAESSWVVTLGELVYLMCSPCVETLGTAIPDRMLRARWAKENSSVEDEA